MPRKDECVYDDPERPWKWMSNGNGGYAMYYKGEELCADDLEYFLNSNNYSLGLALTLVSDSLKKPIQLRKSKKR